MADVDDDAGGPGQRENLVMRRHQLRRMGAWASGAGGAASCDQDRVV